GELPDRQRELACRLDARLHVAQRHAARRDAISTDDGDRHIVQVAEELDRADDDAREKLSAEACREEPLVVTVELLLGLLRAAEDLDQRVARVHLLDMAVEAASPLPLSRELLLRPAPDEERDDHRQGHDDERYE